MILSVAFVEVLTGCVPLAKGDAIGWLVAFSTMEAGMLWFVPGSSSGVEAVIFWEASAAGVFTLGADGESGSLTRGVVGAVGTGVAIAHNVVRENMAVMKSKRRLIGISYRGYFSCGEYFPTFSGW